MVDSFGLRDRRNWRTPRNRTLAEMIDRGSPTLSGGDENSHRTRESTMSVSGRGANSVESLAVWEFPTPEGYLN